MPTPEQIVADQVEYFDLGSNVEPGSGEPAPVEPVVQPTPAEPASVAVDPKDDPKRMEYWQSRADKMAARNKELERLEPLERLLAERQDIVEVIKEKVSGKPAEPVKPALVKPDKPAKPADYDSIAAASDPDSPSFKYRASLETYQENYINYQEQKEALREAEFERVRTEQTLRERAVERDTKMRAQLQAKGIVGAEVDKFIQVMDSPQTFTLDKLIEYYTVVTKGSAQPPAVDPKLTELQRRSGAGTVPLPVGIEGGSNPNPVKSTEADDFNTALMSSKRK